LLNSTKVGKLAMSDRQLCRATKFRDKVAQLWCVSDMGLMVCDRRTDERTDAMVNAAR